MKPAEFTRFDDEIPIKNKWIIVTNNIDAQTSRGEMSHVWLTNFCIQGSKNNEGFIMFDDGDRKVINLTHWKYA